MGRNGMYYELRIRYHIRLGRYHTLALNEKSFRRGTVVPRDVFVDILYSQWKQTGRQTCNCVCMFICLFFLSIHLFLASS